MGPISRPLAIAVSTVKAAARAPLAALAGLGTRATRHRGLARWALTHIRHPLDRARDGRGRCSVCGTTTRFAYNRWVLGQAVASSYGGGAFADAHRERESLFCLTCHSNLRARLLANALLAQYAPHAQSLSELTSDFTFRSLQIAEINAIGSTGSMHSVLAQLPNLAYSEYAGSESLGQTVDGVRNEDICQLSYESQSFDLVLTSDTLEHVPDAAQALRETFRILRPGGRHIFTVPTAAWRQESVTRAKLSLDGQLVHLAPPVYHGRGGGPFRLLPARSDFLAFTDFGADVLHLLQEAGFEADARSPMDDIAGVMVVYTGTVPLS